jgi:hypothetical protein
MVVLYVAFVMSFRDRTGPRPSVCYQPKATFVRDARDARDAMISFGTMDDGQLISNIRKFVFSAAKSRMTACSCCPGLGIACYAPLR